MQSNSDAAATARSERVLFPATFGQEPLLCPRCGTPMDWELLYHPGEAFFGIAPAVEIDVQRQDQRPLARRRLLSWLLLLADGHHQRLARFQTDPLRGVVRDGNALVAVCIGTHDERRVVMGSFSLLESKLQLVLCSVKAGLQRNQTSRQLSYLTFCIIV